MELFVELDHKTTLKRQIPRAGSKPIGFTLPPS
jgi:hypothetical protein